MHIRPAITSDIPSLVALGHQMHRESIYSPYPLDEEKLSMLLKYLINDPLGIVLVAEEAGILGGFAGTVVEHWFGLTKQALDYALFVEPSTRGGRVGYRLLHAYIDEAKRLGADQIVMANSTGYDKDRVAQLFQAVGFEQTGYVLAMHVPREDK